MDKNKTQKRTTLFTKRLRNYTFVTLEEMKLIGNKEKQQLCISAHQLL